MAPPRDESLNPCLLQNHFSKALAVVAGEGVTPEHQHWPWWPLLPLYPYGRRRTLVRELIPGQILSLIHI